MKKLPALLLCFCLLLLPTRIAGGRDIRKLDSPSKPAVSPNASPKVFNPVVNFFKRLFQKRKSKRFSNLPLNVAYIELSRKEIVAACATSDNSCVEPLLVNVAVTVEELNDFLITYNYTVSAGRIIGEGANVIWDLSGVEPGTYTITAGIDDGCGVCGRTETREVKVVKCPNCD